MKNKLNWQKTKLKQLFKYFLFFICWKLLIADVDLVLNKSYYFSSKQKILSKNPKPVIPEFL